jgi:transposase
MFFRLKATQSGQVLKLVESYRDEFLRPRHRAVVSLGNAAIAPCDYKPIAKAVEDRLYARSALFVRALDAKQMSWVDRICRQVAQEGRWHAFAPQATSGDPVVDRVRIGEVTHEETAELGPALLGWEIWRRLGMPERLARLGFNRSQRQAAAICVINRLVDPVNEHGLLDWYRRTGLAELMGDRLAGAGDDRFYRVGDLLLARKSALEGHLRERQQSLFNLERTVLLYDLTNTHFEGLCQRNPKARRGANKQKRNDCPQVVVGMVFDQYGFELAHETFEGNLNDGKSLLRMIGSLAACLPETNGKPLVIVDGGISTDENLRLLHEHGFRYLVNDSRRQRARYLEEFRKDKGFAVVQGRDGKPPVRVRAMADAVGGEGRPAERIVLCKSDPRGAKEQAIASNAEKRWLADLDKLAKRVAKKRLVDREKIVKAIGSLEARHPRARRFYDVSLEDRDGGLRLGWKRDEEIFQKAADLWGCYVLRTDEMDLDEQQLWHLYIRLTQAEDGFRALKSNLGLRPNPHHKEGRVDAHVFICVLAYHLLRHVLWTLEQKGDHRNWETLKRILRTHCYTTLVLPMKNGQTHKIRKAGQPEECQKAIYAALGIPWRSLPCRRTVLGATQGPAPNPPPPPATL